MDKKSWNKIFRGNCLNESVLTNVNTDIKKQKAQLEKRWKTKGGYENFGDKEVRKLTDKYVDISDYSDEMNKVRKAIDAFDNWAMNYTG